jgi:L-threonylcarbamoyladenylate synthase
MILLSQTTSLEDALERISAALDAGGVALVPTDTVYGLACRPDAADAVQAIYDLKARPRDRRLPIIVSGEEDARRLGLTWSDDASLLAQSFWPGALTIAVGVGDRPAPWLEGRDEVALRAPADELLLALASQSGPFLMTSANRHGAPTPEALEPVLGALYGEPAVALDGGTRGGAASTLVNVNLPEPAVEREGAIPADLIATALAGD